MYNTQNYYWAAQDAKHREQRLHEMACTECIDRSVVTRAGQALQWLKSVKVTRPASHQNELIETQEVVLAQANGVS